MKGRKTPVHDLGQHGIGHFVMYTRINGIQNLITTMVLKNSKSVTFAPKIQFSNLTKEIKSKTQL